VYFLKGEKMNMDQLFSVIANVGFPIAVSVYLLVRVENRLETLSQAIHELANAVNHIEQ
jgi:HAMP domain-containing protein